MRTYLPRSLVAASLILIAAGAYAQSAYFNQVMSLNPIGYWPLQETTQPPAANVELNNGSLGSIANMYYATNSAAIITSVGGPMGNSAKLFTGNSAGYALVPTTDNRVSLAPGKGFTVETWAFPRTYGGFGAVLDNSGNIQAGGNNAANYKAGWALSQNYLPTQDNGGGTSSGALYGWSFTAFNGQGDFGGAEAVAPFQYQTNNWYYLVGVFDGTNCTLYINGVPASSTARSTPMQPGTAFLPDTWDPIQVACSRGIGANSYNGAVSEIAIYSNALTSVQVANHYAQALAGFSQYQTAVTGDNPYMYWHMNSFTYFPPALTSLPAAANYGSQAANTTNIANASVNSVYQAGTLPGMPGPSYAGFGSPSYACAFNGLVGAVDAGYNPTLDPTGSTTPETLVAWFKTDPCDNNGRWNSIASHGDASSWRLKIHNGAIVWDTGNGIDMTGPAVNINDGNWHMLAGVYNPVNGSNIITLDSTLSVSIQTNRNITGKPTLDAWIGGAGDNINPAGGAEQFFAGSIAHVAYFNTALSSAQIQSLYTAAAAPPNILIQPVGVAGTVSGGTTNVFSVTASGASTLTYQWYLTNSGGLTQLSDDSVHISGSQTSTLTVTNLADAESGSYFVIVSNSYGSATSSMAGLAISSEPFIVSQTGAGALQLFAGQNYTFSVTAVGLNLSYQWYTNGVADTTAGTTSAYALTSVPLSLSGSTYRCIVSNSLNTATSVLATLTVVPLPASLTSGGTYGSNIMSLGPTAYWPMHEVAAGVPGDAETNLGTLGALGTAYYADWDPLNISNLVMTFRNVPGALGGDSDTAVDFNRTVASYMILPHISSQATIKPPFSVETWVNPTDEATYMVLAGQGGGSALNGTGGVLGGFALEWGGSNGKSNCFSLALWNGNGSANDELESQSIYPGGQWYHVVSTFDGTNIALYVNGAPIGSFQNGTTTAAMNPDFWSPLCIGGGRWGTGPTAPTSGTLDEVAIYTNVLSAARVSRHYSDGTSGGAGVYKGDVLADKPLIYYRMDAPAYVQPPRSTWPVLNNYGSVALNGVYTPGTVPGSLANMPIANLGSTVSAPLNGNGAYADAGFSPALSPLGYTSFSYTAFFKGYPADDRSFSAIMAANDSTWRSTINSAGKVQAHGTADVVSTNVYNDGNWHQMIFTYQGNATTGTGTNLLYVDGTLAGTNSTAQTNNPAGSPGPEVLLGNEFGFAITQGSGANQGIERSFSGSICEAAFFNGTVLTPTQVANLYAAAGVAPFFVKQPSTANVNQGSAFTNTVIVNGSGGSFTYQWYTNGVPLTNSGSISGAQSASLVLNPVTAAMANADYYCVATSTFGTATSTPAALTVNTAPSIVGQQPASPTLLVLQGSTLSFAITATGATPFTYYWSSNSVLVQSGTNSGFIVTNIQVSGGGNYSVVVSNSLGTASASWSVTVISAPGGFPQAVLGLHPFGYWRLNEADDNLTDGNAGRPCHDYISGNNGIYQNTVLGNPGYNFADASDPNYDPETSAGFALGTYGTPNNCAYNISNIDVSAGGVLTNIEFTVQAWVMGLGNSGNSPGIASKGHFNNEEFTLDTGNGGDDYRFELRSAASTSYNANSQIPANDNLWHFLVGVCDEANGKVTLYIDGTNAGSAAIPTNSGIFTADAAVPFSIGARQSSTLGVYDQQFHGYINDVAMFNYALTSNQVSAEYFAAGIAPLFITQPPVSTNISFGGTLKIVATAEGSPPLYYQWLDVNNSPVTGQTNTTLTVSGLTTNNTYTLQVTNAFGTTLSSNCVVAVVQGVPVIEQDVTPTSAEIVAGSALTVSTVVDGSQPITYTWEFNGQPLANGGRISGADTSVLTINAIKSSDAGTYQLFVTNSFGGGIPSSQFTLTVVPSLPFNGGEGWTFQGTSGSSLWVNSNVLQLTFDRGNESNSAFSTYPLYVGAFEASFLYQVPPPTTGTLADGVTFCIQDDPRGATALGSGGGGFGYSQPSGITPSVAFEINLFPSAAGGTGVAFGVNASVGPNGPTGSLVFNTGDVISNFVTYNGSVITVTMTDAVAGTSFTTNAVVNIPAVLGASTGYVGFTGADGGSEANQQISDFTFVSDFPLSAKVSGGNAIISWPAGSDIYSYILQSTPSLNPGLVHWTTVGQTPVYSNGQFQVSVPATANAFYRLVLQ